MNNRRSFLKNTALGGLAFGVSSSANQKSKTNEDLLCNPTTLDYYGPGPFYTDNPPMIEENILAPLNEQGERIIISGRILNLECNQFIPDAIVDVWQANNEGQYDNQGYKLRGYTKSNDQGFYLFETIRPGKYLNGNSFRPSHIHYKVSPPGFDTLTTQLYFEGDTSIAGDAAASITSGTYDATDRIISLSKNSNNILEGTFDIIINGEGISVGTNDLHLNKGMVYKVSPNPFTNQVEIKYGVFKKAKVGLLVYNLSGQQVAVLEDKNLNPDKYTSIWKPEETLPKGHYFIALKINDLQVHYLKIIKQ